MYKRKILGRTIKIICHFVIIISFSFIVHAQSTNENINSDINSLLEKACSSQSNGQFTLFLKKLDNSDFEVKEQFLSDEKNFIKIYNFIERQFNKGITDTVINTYMQVIGLYNNCAECSEMLAESFSDFFVKDIGSSLAILEEFDNKTIENKLIESILFKEENAALIIAYIQKKGLLDKPYYKLFQKYAE